MPGDKARVINVPTLYSRLLISLITVYIIILGQRNEKTYLRTDGSLSPLLLYLDIRICRVCGEARARQSLGIFDGIYCIGPFINETVRYENARTVGLDLYPGYYFRKAYAP